MSPLTLGLYMLVARPEERAARLDGARRGPYSACMCLICVDFNRGALRPSEARRALREMREALPEEHVRELERTLSEAEKKAAQKP